MSLELGLQIVVALLLLFVGWQMARAWRARRWGSGRNVYRREEEPAEYWFHFVWATLVAATFVWIVAVPADRLQGSTPWRYSFLIFFGVPAAFWLVRSLRTGSTGLGDLRFDRGEEPRLFWLLVAAHAAVVAFSAWAATGWGSPGPRDFREDIEPVRAAVRFELAPAGGAAFRNVRIDGGSRLVCGEASVAGGPARRFFGAVSGDGARATVEGDRFPGFDRAYRRVCTGRPFPADGRAGP